MATKKPKTTAIVPATEQPAKPGPKPKLDYGPQLLQMLRQLGKIQCTVEECAAVLGCSLRTMQYMFAEHPDTKDAHEEGKLVGLMSLRRSQFALAEKNATMNMWLGKQYLGQREPVQQIETGRPGDFSNLTDAELAAELTRQAKELADLDPEFARTMVGSPATSKGSSTRH